MLAATLVGAGDIRHIEMSAADRLIECARATFGKPVFRANWAGFPVDLAMCTPDKAALTASFRRAEQRVVETSDGVLIVPERAFHSDLKNPAARALLTMDWKSFRVRRIAENFRDFAGNRPLSQSQLDAIAEGAFRAARPVPLDVPYHAEAGETDITLFQHATVDLHTFHAGDPPLAVVVVSAEEDRVAGSGRLIVGDWSDGTFTPRWDSVVINTRGFGLGYNDFDRDGTDEIIIQGEFGTGRYEKLQMTVFDLDGREWTRQKQCAREDVFFDESESACPITAEDIEIDPDVNGPKEIVVTARHEDIQLKTPNRKVRYTLQNRQYLPQVR